MQNKLQKRDCGIEMKLVPYGSGWSDVYLNIGEDNLYFIISAMFGDTFTNLLRILYFIHPENDDPERDENYFIHGEGTGEFSWDEEGAYSKWRIEREGDAEVDFDIKIIIDICRREPKHYEYTVRYQDFCYAVAKACTEVLKSHGLYGYHHSVYFDDMPLRYLLFIKCAALNNFEARAITDMGDKNGESSPFEKELELLSFDM